MSKRYLCPKHKEQTPSVVAYKDHAYCFGCSQIIPLDELGVAAEDRIQVTYVEDIEESIKNIKRLPKRNIRGFDLHYNDRGYYLLWGSPLYYKFRILGVDSGSKYRGPSGHNKPWFKVYNRGHKKIALVEGEFNAMSLAALEPPFDVVSPGGAGDFYSKGSNKELTECTRYDTVYIIVDDDTAGAQAAIESASKLKVLGVKDVQIKLVKRDFNEIYQEGKEKLKDECRALGLL